MAWLCFGLDRSLLSKPAPAQQSLGTRRTKYSTCAYFQALIFRICRFWYLFPSASGMLLVETSLAIRICLPSQNPKLMYHKSYDPQRKPGVGQIEYVRQISQIDSYLIDQVLSPVLRVKIRFHSSLYAFISVFELIIIDLKLHRWYEHRCAVAFTLVGPEPAAEDGDVAVAFRIQRRTLVLSE